MEALGCLAGGVALIALGIFLIRKAKKNGGGGVYDASKQYRNPHNEPWMKK